MTSDEATAATAFQAVRAGASLRSAALLFLAVGLGWVVYHRAAWRFPELFGTLVALAAAQAILHALLPKLESLRARATYFVPQTALAIARLAGGYLGTASKPGEGTVLRLHLPRGCEEAAA